VHRAAAAATTGVVRLLDFFVEPASVFLVLELCGGPDLSQVSPMHLSIYDTVNSRIRVHWHVYVLMR